MTLILVTPGCLGKCASMCETCESGDIVYCTKCKNDIPVGIFDRDSKKGVCLEERFCAVGITELNNIRYCFAAGCPSEVPYYDVDYDWAQKKQTMHGCIKTCDGILRKFEIYGEHYTYACYPPDYPFDEENS